MITFRQAAVMNVEPQITTAIVYSSDKKLVGRSFDLRVSNKQKTDDIQKFTKMGLFQIESFSSLKLSDPKMYVYNGIYNKQAKTNILNNSVWNGPNVRDHFVAFTKDIAEIYRIDHMSRVALLSEPFRNAWTGVFVDTFRDKIN